MKELIYIDWGTTNCRIFCLDANFKILSENNYPNYGILSLKTNDNYLKFYQECIQPLRKSEDIPIYTSGMVGSSPYGWQEAPQLTIPITKEELHKHIVPVKDVKNMFIIPGIKKEANEEVIDVIRGEEIQAFGIANTIKEKDAMICLPGTHSKWLLLEGNQITDFKTEMTGELFNILCKHSILGALMTSDVKEINTAYFLKGVKEAKENNNLLNSLFKGRASFLNKPDKDNIIGSYVSGILIGYEIAKVVESIDLKNKTIYIISSASLELPYTIALEYYNLKSNNIPAKEAGIQGLKAIITP